LALSSLALADVADYVLPPEPAFVIHRVTAKEELAARKAKTAILKHLFGERAENVARFNRLDSRFVYAGRKLKVPDLPTGAVYSPMPVEYRPAIGQAKYVLIDLKRQFLGAYENGRLVASYPISSGRYGYPTPAGDNQVTLKKRLHKSSLYPPPNGGWPMPWAVRFRGTQYWIHAGDLPGRPDSHGCIRLFPADAKAFYDWAEIGLPVRLVPSL
jgi:hypothetical protein